MSFYSYKNAGEEHMPCRIKNEGNGNNAAGVSNNFRCTERVCIQVKKVYDACLQQEQLDDIRVTLHCVHPLTPSPVPPFEFVSCRSTDVKGTLHDVKIDPIPNREHFARVRATVEIPIEVVFLDANGREFTGKATITVRKDVILFVPDDSVIPFFVDDIVSAICVMGTWVGDNTFVITCCVTVILKIVAEVDLLIPAFGFCRIPPCEEFAENICDEFFSLPIFPPQLDED
jgi:hypothetical protein